MQKHWDYFEYRIAENYLLAMVNGDFSDMDDIESGQYRAFDAQARDTAMDAGFTVGHWAQVDGSGEDWGQCEISGLAAMRCTVRLMVYKTI